jgi:hypothetical protein
MRNKMTELRNIINQAQDTPDMILVTEVKPKNAKYQTTEAELSNRDSTKETCVYTLNTLQARTPI